MKNKTKCDIALLSLLKESKKKDVDYLVHILTDGGSGRVALSSSIKDLLLHEKNDQDAGYSEEGLRNLLHELQEFGGHSIINIFRGEPLSYEEILTDVHKKLNGDGSNSKSSKQKEREIVLGLFGDGWFHLSESERFERCTETKVVTGFFKLTDNLNYDEKGIALGFTAAASAAAFLAFRMIPIVAVGSTVTGIYQSIGEAYRVTIPFIAQIAYIRMSNERGLN